MNAEGKKREQCPPPVGPRIGALRLISTGLLVLFVLMILTLVGADVAYLISRGLSFGDVWDILTSRSVLSAIRLSVVTSLITLALVMLFSVPVGYALSRYRFFGSAVANAIVDVPIVLPPVVIGLSLLAFFGTGIGQDIKGALHRGTGWSLVSGIGIVLCQFLVSISYCIRAAKASFDSVDQTLEHVALSLGCSPWQAFCRVTLPLARNGLIAGLIMAWARAMGVFGPLMVFVGTGPRVQVMPTTIWLELSVGNVETSLTVALVTLAMSAAALAVVHRLAPGRKWR